MKPSKRKFFSGNTVQQAVVAAANEYGLDPSEIAYRQIEKRHGFLRTRKRVVIAVDPAAPRLAAEPPASQETAGAPVVAPQAETPPAAAVPPKLPPVAETRFEEPAPVQGEEPTPEAGPVAASGSQGTPRGGTESGPKPSGEAPQRGDGAGRRRKPTDAAAVRGAGEVAMEKMVTLTGLDLSWTVSDTEEGIEVEIAGPDAELLLEEHGKAIFAMEHLLPKLVRGISDERAYCQIDCLNFKENRLEELRKLALSSAEEVRDSGEPKTLKLLNPAERRLVHMALADQEGVETESEGRGYLKRLTIWPLD